MEDMVTTRRKILAVIGPTATGKSDLAVKIAKQFGGEVVSADSRQVYRGLDIGTGKITPEEMRGIPHHLLDVADPKERYTVQDYKKDAVNAIDGILARNTLPILCGGTGFYIQAVIDGITFPEAPPNEPLRQKLAQLSTDKLFEHLKTLDPTRAKNIDPKNPRRLIRAIEIADALGYVPRAEAEPSAYDPLFIGLDMDDDILRERIRVRLEKRLADGMLEEAEHLHTEGLSYARMEELGLEYRYMARHLQGELSHEEMVRELESKIWHYARRQRTWFRRDPRVQWFTSNETDKILLAVEKFLHSQN